MKSISIKIHITEWFITPSIRRYIDVTEYNFLCLGIRIETNNW